MDKSELSTEAIEVLVCLSVKGQAYTPEIAETVFGKKDSKALSRIHLLLGEIGLWLGGKRKGHAAQPPGSDALYEIYHGEGRPYGYQHSWGIMPQDRKKYRLMTCRWEPKD